MLDRISRYMQGILIIVVNKKYIFFFNFQLLKQTLNASYLT